METNRTCPQCSQPLAADAPDGLCPQCLMKAASGPPPSTSGVGLADDIIDIGDPAEVARKLPQFEILEMLGRGGMGVVYKARQLQLDRLVALKILPPLDALSADFVARFTREARALAKLNHPNIVNVHDFGETNGLYYIIMEYVDGANLRQLLETRKLTPAEALAIVPKICDALEYAHEEGLVHRDIKPENLLIDKKGRVKIADFGLAKLLRREPLDMTLTLSGMALGTLRYMAPEQMDKPETVDHRADLYSLGVVIYEMLTGETPVGRFELPSQKAQVDVRLDEIVLHALEREPARRYQHASEIRTDMENVTSQPPVAAPAAAEKASRPVEESAAVRRARASWFGRRPEPFRTLLPPALAFLELVLILASFAGWPSPWLELTWNYLPHKHGAGSTSSFAFHPFTFTFFLAMAACACPFMAAWFARIDHLVRYGRRFHELQKDIHRQAKSKMFGFAVAAILAPILMAGIFEVIATGGPNVLASVTNTEFRLGPNSKAYDELLIDLPFHAHFEKGVEHYRRPNQWDMSIALKSKNSAEPVTMDIEMPSLKASYDDPKWSNAPHQIVLDIDELTKWMGNPGKIDVQDEKVKKEIAELMALLKQFSHQAPVDTTEYVATATGLMPDFSNVGSTGLGGSFSVMSIGWVIGIYLGSMVISVALYLVATIRIQRAAFELDREVRERGASVLASGPLPRVKFGALPRDIRARLIQRAGLAAAGLLLLPAAAAWRESAQPRPTKQTYHYDFASDSKFYNLLTMNFAFESYVRDGETWLVQPKPFMLELVFTMAKNYSAETGRADFVSTPGKGVPAGDMHAFTVELPGLHANLPKIGSVTLNAEELERWLRLNLVSQSAPQHEEPELKRDAADWMAFLKNYATQPPSTHDAFLAATRKIPHLRLQGSTMDTQQESFAPAGAIIPALAAAVGIFLALLPLLKRSAVRAATQEIKSGPENTGGAESATSPLAGGPRLSRLALWGAICAGAGLLAGAVIFAAVSDSPPGKPDAILHLSIGFWIFFSFGGLFGSTILGSNAIGAIKRSGGKIHGLPLAAFAAWLVPLLALGSAAVVVTHLLQIAVWTKVHMGYVYDAGRLVNSIAPPPATYPGMSFLILDGIVAIGVCFFAARAAWRAIEPANQGSFG